MYYSCGNDYRIFKNNIYSYEIFESWKAAIKALYKITTKGKYIIYRVDVLGNYYQAERIVT